MVWDFCEGRKRKIEDYGIEVPVLLLILYCLTAIATIVLNGVVFLAVKRTSSLFPPSRILLASLSLTDFFIGAIIQPIGILYFIAIIEHWPNVFCLTLLSSIRLGYCFGVISMGILTVISIDRYLAVKCKMSYRLIVTKKRVLAIVIGGWILTCCLFVSSIDDFVFQTLAPIFTMLAMSLLLIVTALCYTLSFLSLKQLSVQVSTNATQPMPDFSVLKYKHSLVTMAMILLLFMISYSPLILLNILQLIMTIDDITVYLNFCELIAMLHSLINPLVYLWRMREIRQTAKAMIFKGN
jgi:hypothetical protein